MRNYTIIIGYVLGGITIALHTSPVFAQTNLYKDIVQMTKYETMKTNVDLMVQRYVPQVMDPDPMLVQEKHIDLAIQKIYSKLCEDGRPDGSSLDTDSCFRVADEITEVASRAQWIRSLARDLQIIATSYEAGIVGITGHPNSLSAKWPSIISIWQSGSDKATSPVVPLQVRAMPLPDSSTLDGKFDTLETALKALIEEDDDKKLYDKISSAVWRYRHGAQELFGTDCTDGEAGPDVQDNLEYLDVRWCNVETALEEIYNEFPTSRTDPLFDPPLKPQELVVFPHKTFPGINIAVWIRQDNIGLLWIYGLEPVMPSFIKPDGDKALTKLEYPEPPEEPEQDEGICSHPFGKRGYLCRPFAYEMCPTKENDCARDPASGDCLSIATAEPNPTATGSYIELTSCESQNNNTKIYHTISGQNACQLGGWRSTIHTGDFADESDYKIDNDPSENLDIKSGECSHCIADLVCKGTCGGRVATKPTSVGEREDGEGRIEVCVQDVTELDVNFYDDEGNVTSTETKIAPAPYLALHALTEAQQKCDHNSTEWTDSLTGGPADCCEVNWKGSVVACNALAEDGNFHDTRITIEFCASMMTNFMCSDWTDGDTSNDFPCLKSGTEPGEQLQNEFLQTLTRNESNVPERCPETVTGSDGRIVTTMESLPKVCSPNCIAKYENTIGNNLCYIAQCTEQSVEEHRLVPGRFAQGVQDEAFPWDSCSVEDPQNGAILPLPPQLITSIPPYRPQFLVQELDREFCRINGFPSLQPTSLCSVDVRSRLGLPIQDQAEMLTSFSTDSNDLAIEVKRLQNSTYNIGARIGTSLYKYYMNNALHSFNEVMGNATGLIRKIGETTFPRTMCPRFYTGGCNLFAPPASSSSSSSSP